jgi:two-component sensor histidine kinase
VALRKALEERSNEDLRRHIETQDLLIGELNHRVKNTLTSVQAMARMSFKDAGETCRPGADAFEARLLALSAAHNLLNEANWTGASLADLVRVEIAFAADTSRVTMEGPEVELTARETVSLALVIHELTTNGMKYGALRPDKKGRLALSWTVKADRLHFRWESYLEGEIISTPVRAGFGTQMIRRAVERELSGELHMDWQPDGLKAGFSVPLEKLAMKALA